MASIWIQTRASSRGVTYHVKYRLGGRESSPRHGGAFATKREAKIRRDWIAGEIAAGRAPDLKALAAPSADPRTFKEIATEYAESRIDVGESAQKQYRHVIARLGSLGAMRPEDIRVADVQVWVNRQGDLKPKSLSAYLTVLRQFLDHADLDRPNPARDRRLRLRRESQETPDPMDLTEFTAIRDAITAKYRPALEVLERTGLRINELLSLTWGDIDWANARLRVRRGKTGAARRWVPLFDETLELLGRLLPWEDRTPERLVFQGLTDQGLGRAMERACKAAGIAHYHPHDLRHRYISLLVMAGVPWPLIGQIVGHRRASVTLDIYAHVLLDEPPERLEELRARATPVLPGTRRVEAESKENPANEGLGDDMEDRGLEPLTSALQRRRSPS